MPADTSAPTRRFMENTPSGRSYEPKNPSATELDAMFAASLSDEQMKVTAARDPNKTKVSMSLSSAENDSVLLRKDKLKSRIGGAANAESAALKVVGSKLAIPDGEATTAGSLNDEGAKGVAAYLEQKAILDKRYGTDQSL